MALQGCLSSGTVSPFVCLCFYSSVSFLGQSIVFLESSDSPKVPELFLFLPALQIANEVIGEMNLKPEEVFLAQGTLRPDLIESASLVASGKAEVIKTHHNDTELIRKLREEVSQGGQEAAAAPASPKNRASKAKPLSCCWDWP